MPVDIDAPGRDRWAVTLPGLTIGSLFSGIGGLELGLERSGLGHVVWQVEKNPFCREILARHWPHTARFEDVTHVGARNLCRVDAICGGFPCQDVSSAGPRTGLSGARSGLWHEFARIIGELGPEWVIVENVASGASLWVDPVRGALEGQGYATLPIPIAASDCGAPHERKRIFIVAHSHENRQLASPEYAEGARPQEIASDPDAYRLWVESGRRGPGRAGAGVTPDDGAQAPHPHQTGQQRAGYHPGERQHGPTPSHWRTLEPDMVRVVHGVSGRLDKARPRIAALGNSVVPQCAEVVGQVIQRLRYHQAVQHT